MPYASLGDFVSYLESKGDLIRVSSEVSPKLEITEIQTRLLAQQGPAVLFENVVGPKGRFEMPVLANLFGTKNRVAWGMGKEPHELRPLGEALALLRQPEPPDGWKKAAEMIPLLKAAMNMKPKVVSSGPVHDKVITGKDIDLSTLPIQTCWPDEPSPLITWPLVVTKNNPAQSPERFNVGVYRMQVIGPNQTLMRWLKHRGGAQHFQEWSKKESAPLPVAVVIGADPATILAAVSPIPDTMSEYQFAGLLRGRRTELVKCHSIPLKVPATAEIVLEGHVSLEDYRDEGPFGDHTGYYNSVEKFPVFTVSAITTRQRPVYLSTFTGRPPDEPSILGETLNELFVPLMVQQFSEIVDFWLPPEGCSYRIAIVSIKKTYAGQAKRIMMGVWSFLRQFLYTKIVIVVDDDIDVKDWKDVMWAISTRMDPVRDTTLLENTPIDYLDFASPESGLGGKIGLDATNKIGPETNREWGTKIMMEKAIIERVDQKWSEYGLPGKGKSIWESDPE